MRASLDASLDTPRVTLPEHVLARFYPAPVAARYADVLGIALHGEPSARMAIHESLRTHESLQPAGVH
jgi:hypothetical protein